MTMPNPPESRRAADNLDLLVVIDTHPTDTAGYADVVLPDTTYLERHDDFYLGSGRQGWAAIRQPVVAPPGNQRPAWWMAKQLSQRLGVAEYMPFEDMDEYLAKRCELSRHRLRRVPQEGRHDGPEAADHDRGGRKDLEFDTPSKKVEFYSDQLAEAGFDPVPKYTPPDDAPAGYYRLVTGRAPMHTFSKSQTNPLLQGLMDQNEVWVNADTAAAAEPGERSVRGVEEPGRRGLQSRAGEGDPAHPARHGLSGPRIRAQEPHAQERVPERGKYLLPQHELQDRSADGRHEPPHELRHLRKGGLRCHASGWSSTP